MIGSTEWSTTKTTMLIQTNNFTLYQQTYTRDRVSSLSLLCRRTNSYRSRHERESVSNTVMSCHTSPSSKKVVDPVRTAPLSSSARGNNHPLWQSLALARVQKIARSRKTFTCKKWHHSFLLFTSCSCCRGKPWLHPLWPQRGSRSLPRAGSSLTDGFLVWWDWGRGYIDWDATTQWASIGAEYSSKSIWSL